MGVVELGLDELETQDTSEIASQVRDVNDAVNAVQDQVASLPTQADYDNLSNEVSTGLDGIDTSSVPRYAMVSELRRKSCEVTVYGSGEFLVFLHLIGNELRYNKIDVNDADLVTEFLYSEYELEDAATTLPTSLHIVEEGDPEPNDHTHEVTVDEYNLTANGTLLMVVIAPDDSAWEDGTIVDVDFEDLEDDIYYAYATVGLED